MKYLGIDFGSKRVGVAVSDDGGMMAFPKEVVINDGSLIENIKKICEENKIEGIVVGDSRNFFGDKNTIMKKVEIFKEKLAEAVKLPIYMQSEFFTSAEAERLQGKNDMLDASAAALILKHYLDSSVH